MLTVQGLSKSFGDVRAVDGVSFDGRRASVTILAGADGAGKSTVLRSLLGLVKKDEGRILIDGRDIGSDYSLVASRSGYMPERFSLYPDLSVEENLNFFADIHRVPRARKEELKGRLLDKTGLGPFRRRRAGALSGGMRQKLALSAILLSSPEFILLDEPTTGVDPLSRIEFFRIIQDLKAEGRMVLMATPYLSDAEKGDDVVFLRKGRVVAKGSIEQLKKSFPARVFRLHPRGDIFEALKSLEGHEELRRNVYIRGQTLRFMKTGKTDVTRFIPVSKIEEESPSLEDLFIYFERRAE